MPVESSPHRVDTRVIYNRETGEILHIHQASTLPGGRLPGEDELIACAIDVASRSTGVSGEQMDVIRVREEDLTPKIKYMVDVQSKRLVSQRKESAE